MATDNRFSKWQWITTDLVKATSDPRPESYKLNSETIRAEEKLGTEDGWRVRKDIIRPLVRSSMCKIKREQDANGHPTLGVFRPARIKRLVLEADAPDQKAAIVNDELGW